MVPAPSVMASPWMGLIRLGTNLVHAPANRAAHRLMPPVEPLRAEGVEIRAAMARVRSDLGANPAGQAPLGGRDAGLAVL